jgi:hypothetical protein
MSTSISYVRNDAFLEQVKTKLDASLEHVKTKLDALPKQRGIWRKYSIQGGLLYAV